MTEPKAASSPAANRRVGGPEQSPEIVLCANDDHKPRIAAYRVTWPSRRFNPTTACRSCAAVLVRQGAIEAGGVTFEVIP